MDWRGVRSFVFLVCAVTLSAGCAGPLAPEVVTSSTTFSHDFAQGTSRADAFVLNVSSALSYQVEFIGVSAAGEGTLCPLEGSGITVTLVAPDGVEAASWTPDVRGVTGNEDCGGKDGKLQEAAAGVWHVRFAGEGRATAIVVLVAVGTT